jgi:DNA (cytosine-5)-methyltransferase 1
MPAKAQRGTERHILQPMSTQTSQQETGLLSAGAVIAAHRHNGDGQNITLPMDTVTSTHEKALLFAAIDNYQGAARSLGEPLPTQAGSETLSLLSAGVLPFRKHTIPTVHGEPMPTMTSDQIPGLLSATGLVQSTGDLANWAMEWEALLADLTLDDCYFRMLGPNEIGRGCGFDTDFPGHKGGYVVWGSARHQVDGFGNAVSPPIGAWIGARMRLSLHTPEAVMA